MQSSHGQSGVLAVELDRYESGEALERLVDQEELGLDALELVRILSDLLFHDLGRVGRTDEVVLRRLCIVQLHPKIELVVDELVRLERAVRVKDDGHALGVLVQLLDVYLGAELDHMTECHGLLGVSDEERLRYERCVLVEYLRLEEAVEVGPLVSCLEVSSRLEVVRVRIVNLLIVLVEDLELQKVDALLEEIHVAEVLDV